MIMIYDDENDDDYGDINFNFYDDDDDDVDVLVDYDDDVDVVFIFNLGLAQCLVPNLYSYLSVVLAPIFVSTIAFGCAPKLVSSFATIISPC